jgi:hypothetical protein
VQPRKLLSRSLAGLELGSNDSYLHSVALGLERGVWMAPTNFIRMFGWMFKALLFSLLFVTFGIPAFLVMQIGIVFMGLTGRLRVSSRA